MKTRWDFFFESNGLRFERKHTYILQPTEEDLRRLNLPPGADPVRITIEPDDRPYNPAVTQTGMAKITIPLDVEEAKGHAYSLAEVIAQHITFANGGEFKIVYGLVTGERLPENDAEAEDLGETPHFTDISLIEIDDSVSVFDGSSMGRLNGNPLLKQFNVAARSENPIDKYLGLFKILEGTYAPAGTPPSLGRQMKSSQRLFEIADGSVRAVHDAPDEPQKRAAFESLVDSMVDARNQCAHLRTLTGYGYTHGSRRALDALEPLIAVVTVLARKSIESA